MNPWLQVGLIALAVAGVALQITGMSWRLAAGCTCAKGKVCAKCLGESEAIRPKPDITKEAA